MAWTEREMELRKRLYEAEQRVSRENQSIRKELSAARAERDVCKKTLREVELSLMAANASGGSDRAVVRELKKALGKAEEKARRLEARRVVADVCSLENWNKVKDLERELGKEKALSVTFAESRDAAWKRVRELEALSETRHMGWQHEYERANKAKYARAVEERNELLSIYGKRVVDAEKSAERWKKWGGRMAWTAAIMMLVAGVELALLGASTLMLLGKWLFGGGG